MKRLPFCLAVPLLAACWSQQASIQTTPTPLVKKTGAESRPTNEPVAIPVDPATAENTTYRPIGHEVRVIPGGVTLVARAGTGDVGTASAHSALVRCTLPVGRTRARPGQAELTAAMLLAGAEKGQLALERAIAELGGIVQVDVGASETAIDMIVPADRYAAALERLAHTLQTPPSAEAQLESVRLRLLREWRGRFAATPLQAVLPRALDVGAPSPSEWLARTQELTIDEVRTFWRLLCRPIGAIVAIDGALGSTDATFTSTTAALAPWTAGIGTAEPAGTQAAPKPLSGLVWAERPTLPRVGVLLARNELGSDHALEVLVLQACLTQGGIGGRLGRELERIAGTAPVLVEQQVRDGARRYSLLTTTATAEQAVLLDNALTRALDSLAKRPPEDDELATALARARLQVLEEESDPRAWLSRAMTLARTKPDAPFNLAEDVRRLGDGRQLDLKGALPMFRASVLATLVVGGTAPEGARVTKLAEPIPPERLAATFVPDEGGKETAARPYLDAAVRALGGKDALALVNGFAASTIVKGDNGSAIEESTFWRADGRLRRVRRVLGTTIEATIVGDKGTEVSGEQTVELVSDEVRSLLKRAERHPVALVAGWMRGKLRFKLISLRTVEDREMAILELIDPTSERMRMQIDTGSGLIRQIETREHWPSVGKVQLVESYQDYRAQRGIRAPFHVVTDVDTGGMSITTDYTAFVPRAPAQKDLDRGGAERVEDDR